jgi:hypothetical protein
MLSLRKFVEHSRKVYPALLTRQPVQRSGWPLSRALYSTASPSTPSSHRSQSGSFMDGSSVEYMDQMYKAWKADPSSVHKSWDTFFNSESSKGSSAPSTTTHQIVYSFSLFYHQKLIFICRLKHQLMYRHSLIA